MFIDTSAIVAVLTRESGHEQIIDRIVEAQTRSVSPLVRLEAVLAVARVKGSETGAAVRSAELTRECGTLYDRLIDSIKADEVAISPEIGRAAMAACSIYGKGCGHPAKLNLVDCFSYACAKILGVGLIYKGDDFSRTDLA